MKWFEHNKPHHPPSMRRWRERMAMLEQKSCENKPSRLVLNLYTEKAYQLKRVNMCATVKGKKARFRPDTR